RCSHQGSVRNRLATAVGAERFATLGLPCRLRYPSNSRTHRPMYENVAILAAVVLIYSAGAGRVERSWLSGPILFTCMGLVLGPAGIGALNLSLTSTDLRTLAEISLSMVLFTDAARADLAVVRRTIGLPERLLLIG